ncbi:MAG: DUF3301 domain-containing protein [Pseudomonadota bacterium]
MEGLYLIIVVLLGWFWYAGARAREQAVVAVRRACERHGQQLLDETVLLERLRPRRGRDGRVRLSREYSFEFSGGGEARHGGTVVVYGGRIVDLQLVLPDGTLYDSH